MISSLLLRALATGRGVRKTSRPAFVPRVYALEERTLLSTYTVRNLADSGPGSLRQAILDANSNVGADVIVFRDSLEGTLRLASGQLNVTDHLTIRGPRDDDRVTVSGNNASRVFDISPGADVMLERLTVSHGLADRNAPVFAGIGGGILNRGNLTLRNVVVSYNRAVGTAGVTVSAGGYTFTGAGLGGGVSNLGTITVTGSTFLANEARGGDRSTGPDFPNIVFPGLALGGGLHNLRAPGGSARVTESRFADNVAQGGSDCTGSFAGLGGGAGIYNDAILSVARSSFRNNRALGGDNNVSDMHNGHGLGGGVVSGSVLAAFGGPSASLEVSASSFDHNQAVGGDDNRVTLPVGPADAPNTGFGGGILVYQGTAEVSWSQFSHNRAQGGAGGAVQNGSSGGSSGVGGGIFLFSFIGGVTATLTGNTLVANAAIGGPGRSGVRGGDGIGGGLAASHRGAPLAGPGTVWVSHSLFAGNVARGGAGGTGGIGGDGLGGGLFNDAGSTMTMAASLIILNEARHGPSGVGGSDGQGIGGGVYNAGTFTPDPFTVIALNDASTSHDDIFP